MLSLTHDLSVYMSTYIILLNPLIIIGMVVIPAIAFYAFMSRQAKVFDSKVETAFVSFLCGLLSGFVYGLSVCILIMGGAINAPFNAETVHQLSGEVSSCWGEKSQSYCITTPQAIKEKVSSVTPGDTTPVLLLDDNVGVFHIIDYRSGKLFLKFLGNDHVYSSDISLLKEIYGTAYIGPITIPVKPGTSQLASKFEN